MRLSIIIMLISLIWLPLVSQEKKDVEVEVPSQEIEHDEHAQPEKQETEHKLTEEKVTEHTKTEEKESGAKEGKEKESEEHAEEKKEELQKGAEQHAEQPETPEMKQEEAEKEKIEEKESAKKEAEEPQHYFPAKWALENPEAPDTAESIGETLEEFKEPEGIDTVSLEEPQGNWYFKRIWWEQAEGRYDKIRTLVDKIWMSRMDFFAKRRELDKSILDPFFVSAGMSQGELLVILSQMVESIEKEQEKQEKADSLEEQEHTLSQEISAHLETLKQLAVDIESIQAMDAAVDEALIALMDQINRVREFERQAWDNFKEIARVLSDTKAHELYSMMNSAWTNIKNIGTYIDQKFSQHFNELIANTKKQVTHVQEQIKILKEKGIDFKMQAEQIAHKKEEEKAKEKEKREEQAAAQEEDEEKPKHKQGWLEWISSFFTR